MSSARHELSSLRKWIRNRNTSNFVWTLPSLRYICDHMIIFLDPKERESRDLYRARFLARWKNPRRIIVCASVVTRLRNGKLRKQACLEKYYAAAETNFVRLTLHFFPSVTREANFPRPHVTSKSQKMNLSQPRSLRLCQNHIEPLLSLPRFFYRDYFSHFILFFNHRDGLFFIFREISSQRCELVFLRTL